MSSTSQPNDPSFAELLTPAPEVTVEAAAEVARAVFGLTDPGPVTALGSQHDANFVIGEAPRAGGSRGGRFLLKFANPVTRTDELEAQSLAAAHLGDAAPQILVPRTIAQADGALIRQVDVDGQTLAVRLLEFVEGTPLSGGGHLAPTVVAAFGSFAARSALALAAFAHPGTERDLEWDLRQAKRLVDDLLPFVDDAELAGRLRAATDETWARVLERETELPRQVVHGDITDDNVVGRPDAAGRLVPCGIIDFGDVMHTWAVSEIAVTCSAVLHHHGATPASILPAVRAFHAARPLAAAEADVLWPLVVLRAATLVVSAHHAAATDPGNAYTRANFEHEHLIFEVATSVPPAVMTALVRVAAGHPATSTPDPVAPASHEAPVTSTPASDSAPTGSDPSPAAALLPGLAADRIAVLDLSSTSPALARGRFAAPDAESAVAAEALAGGAAAAVTRFGERRLTRSFRESVTAHPCSALGLEAWFVAPQPVAAPWAGLLARVDDTHLRLTGEFGTLELSEVEPADGLPTTADAAVPVAPGTLLGTATHLGVRMLRPGVDPARVPWFATAELAAGWETLAADPAVLLPEAAPESGCGSPTAATPDAAGAPDRTLLERRERSLAEVQEHYYADPPEIERGWRHHLFDSDSRPYLDMVNNVASVGHAHPRIADAVAAQLTLLNTNSRFNYSSIVDFSERLAGLLPDPLDTVFFVNSGTEAVDLALRISWAWSNRRDVVSVREAYHGWSDAADAVSTSVADNPQALATRPDWVHALDAPNAYRGRYRGAEAHRYAQDAVAEIEALVAADRAPATFIAEAFYGNAGGMPLPEGYLRAVYPAIRAQGGLCIADEVQVGYGRLGEHLWGFEQQGVLPDIVTVAKAMGNGHPLGAVITRREVADAYRSQGYFFSSAGGSPVSSVVGTTVLDIIRDEALQENARAVGAHLKARLEQLADRHPLIGAVHGLGLYLGVELVRDRETLEPATQETAALCERMRERGVIVQPTSDRQCVLKIKPPLTLTFESADFFVDTLDEVLTTGW